nr:hypothetical protein [Micromonospora sp. KC213]
MPRDAAGTFEPQIVRNRQRRLTGPAGGGGDGVPGTVSIRRS